MAYKPKDIKERILHRFKIVQGHLKRVVQMVDDDTYCIKVIHQSHAIQQSLKEIDNLTLEHHLKSCVTDAIKGGKQDEAVAEVMKVFKKST